MVRRPVVSTAPSIRVKKRLKVGGVKAPANACSRGRAAPGRRDMRGPPCVGNMGTAIYLHVTSKGVRFVDPNRSREGSERAKVELRGRPRTTSNCSRDRAQTPQTDQSQSWK